MNAPKECFHDHTNVFINLRVDGNRAAEWSIESNSYCSGCMLCSSSAVPRVVQKENRHQDCFYRVLP